MALKPGQEKCINTLDRSIVVAAGAGSGKTFTLTKRIVHAIECGAVSGIDRVLAITFTNKAAGELKSRIKSELRACGMSEQALLVDDAWVSTIHGMCARILRAHALELDIDPAFEMADSALSLQLRDRAIDEVLGLCAFAPDDQEAYKAASKSHASGLSGKLASSLSPQAIDALFAEYPARLTGRSGNSVESMLQALLNKASGHARGFDAFEVQECIVNPAACVFEVLDVYETIVAETLSQKPTASREAWIAETSQTIAEIRAEMEGCAAIDAQSAIRALDRLAAPKRVGSTDYKEKVNEALRIFRSNVMELRLAAAASHLKTLVALGQLADSRFADLKREAGVLDNNDLLVMACAAITGNPEIAALYADKFQLVMVDEFQDTDQMQVDMIKLLAGPGACRLCTVGDAQQSIYRFRGADVAVYRRHLQSVRTTSPDDIIELPDNFRSHPDVLSLVDRVFERPEMFGKEFMSLAPGRNESRLAKPFTDDAPRVRVLLTSNSHCGATSERVREVAAARIADAFADLRDKGHDAGEMAVLLGGMSGADVYASALRARGFACVISGGSVFSRTQEALIMLDFARMISNPNQTEALFNVLTSPMFALDAGEVLTLATCKKANDANPRWENLHVGLMAKARALQSGDAQETLTPRLRLAVRVLGDALRDAARKPVAHIAMRCVVDSGWVSRLQREGAEGLAKAGNVYKAIRMIDSIERDRAVGPAGTARLFETMLAQVKEAPGALSSTGGDFVRIMTVHASKGLEFPIVAVAEFRDKGASASPLLIGDVDGSVRLSLDLQNTVASLEGSANLKNLSAFYGQVTGGTDDEESLLDCARHAQDALSLRAAVFEADRVGEAEEAKRLLYVALTRAKEALVVSLKGKRTKDNPNATPRDCLGALAFALAGDEGGFPVGESAFSFGGSQPAWVEHIALDVDGFAENVPFALDVLDADGAQDQADAEKQVDEANQGDKLGFMVPQAQTSNPLLRVPCASAHEGVFSYSSVAQASHEGDVLQRLAKRYFIGCDASACDTDDADAGFADADNSAFMPTWQLGQTFAAQEDDDDDGAWAYAGIASADSDKATNLGTAFHRLAQYAVVSREARGCLAMPPAARIEALSAAGKLDVEGRRRLKVALERWFASDIAHEMARFNDLRAEVPFFVSVSCGKDASAFLEGEIDLLGLDERGNTALVVDYKTGGRASESSEELKRKHVLQASCYAYALLLQGVKTVEAVFVRVEQPSADSANQINQPQCVRYRFEKADLPQLQEAIAEVYSKS